MIRGARSNSVWVVWGVVLMMFDGAATAQVRVHLEADSNEYVVGQPMKLRVALVNCGSDIVGVVQPDRLGQNMEYMVYEVRQTRGSSEYRRSRYVSYFRSQSSLSYKGEPLSPGDSVVCWLYPYETFGVGERHEAPRPLVSRAGHYELRVIYDVASSQYLRGETDGRAPSNWVEFSVTEPTSAESEILSAAWTPGNLSARMGDNMNQAEFDEARLREVIAKYPHNPMTRYARFSLARSLVATHNGHFSRTGREGSKILSGLMDDYPDFRYQEVRMELAEVYMNDGQNKRAAALLKKMLQHMPELIDDERFMADYFKATTGSYRAYYSFRQARYTGTKNDVVRKIREDIAE